MLLHGTRNATRRAAVAATLAVAFALPGVAGAQAPPSGDAAALIEAGHWKQARALLEPRLAANPADAEAAYLMSRVKGAFRDYDGALALAEKAVAANAKDARFHEQLANVYGQQTSGAGMTKALGLAKKMRKEAETAVALDPRRFDAQSDLMEFFQRAPGLFGGDKKKARAKADEILALDACRGHIAHAELALANKDTAAAVDRYRKAVAANAASVEAHLTLGSVLVTKRQYDEAEAEARAAQKIDPHRAGSYTLLVAVDAFQGRLDALDATLAESETAVPDNRVPWYQAGRILLSEGREFPRAERYFRHYLEQEPEGNGPTLAHAHWRLGLVLEKQGRTNDAIAELESALKLKPDLDEAKKDLKRLKKQA